MPEDMRKDKYGVENTSSYLVLLSYSWTNALVDKTIVCEFGNILWVQSLGRADLNSVAMEQAIPDKY